MEIMLASSNSHKIEEFQVLLPGVELKLAPDSFDVEETGETFSENALIKAKAYYQKYKVPVLSDDSGLVVNALPNDLGVYSARFGGPGIDQDQKNQLLLEKLKNQEDRNAYFVSVLCFIRDLDNIFFFEGRIEGEIALSIHGDEGFGYDPLFIPTKHPNGKTLAEDVEFKSKNSHRAVSCQQLLQFLSTSQLI